MPWRHRLKGGRQWQKLALGIGLPGSFVYVLGGTDQLLLALAEWAGEAGPELRSGLGLPGAVRRISGGKWRTETSYTITSLTSAQGRPAQLAELDPRPLETENQLHWVRDVAFFEDLSAARTGTKPHVMAAIRDLVVSILRLAGHASIARALRHTARNPDRAFRLLTDTGNGK